ncbi:MAG: hypothetical protein NXI04_19505 [Planctomycetaceae bacterium]|nr:hypothetical protein [Planctomycetaceae bacterium]
MAEQGTQIQQQGAENSRVDELLETTQASARQTQRMLDASLTETKQLNATIHKLNRENRSVAESLAEKESANEILRQANESLKVEVASFQLIRVALHIFLHVSTVHMATIPTTCGDMQCGDLDPTRP